MCAMNVLYYSANTVLAGTIAEQYYGDVHWVWCSDHFDESTAPPHGPGLAPSSTPANLIREYREAVRGADRHSAAIARNKAGIVRGAATKRSMGAITVAQEREISDIVYSADTRSFRPLLYLIPREPVEHLVTAVPVKERANPAVPEYRIESLPRHLFDVINIPW